MSAEQPSVAGAKPCCFWQVDHEALAELEGFGFDRETVLAALAGGKRNSITATYRLALHQRALRARDSASASGMFAVRDGAPRRSGGWTAPEGEDSDDAGADGPLSLADIP